MGSPDLFKALTQTLQGGEDGARALPAEDVKLTPYLSVVVAILYMMAVDGDISDRESSQLQSVIGADDAVLRRAVAYARTHEVDQFLREAPALLDNEARLCLLINVADSLMADGELQKVELMLFDRMLSAFGQSRESFQHHFDAIAAKGRTSVLGDFDAAANSEEMTPPKALVVAMLYMMSADGSMATEEVGRLSAAIGGSQALLKASLRYVSQVRAPQFLALAASILDKRQRMCVLLNACDAMLSDHQVDVAERELLGRMMVAFGIEPAGLDAYLTTLRVKNDVPHDTGRPVAKKAQQNTIAPARRKKREEGQVFERKRTWSEETGEAGTAGPEARQRAAAAAAGQSREGPLDSRISRTMQDNIDRMSDGFDDEVTMARMESQSRAEAPADAPAMRGKGPAKQRSATDGKGAAETRALKDGSGDKDLRSTRDGEGAKDLRTTRDSKGEKDQRKTVDGKGDSDLRSTKDGDGPSDLRNARDGKGASDLRAARDAQGGKDLRASADGNGPSDLRNARDAEGASDLRAAADGQGAADQRSAVDAHGGAKLRSGRDAEGAADLRTAADASGAGDLRAARDAQGLKDRRSASDAEGDSDQRTAKDAQAAGDVREARDAQAKRDRQPMSDDGLTDPSRHWQDADLPADRRDLRDAAGMPSSKHLVDDRRAFDRDDDEDEADALSDPIEGRMGEVRDRTNLIRDHVDALKGARNLRAGSRLPSLPSMPRPATRDEAPVAGKAGTASTDSAGSADAAINSNGVASTETARSDEGNAEKRNNESGESANAADNAGNANSADSADSAKNASSVERAGRKEHEFAGEQSATMETGIEQAAPMLFASDEGGPKMTEASAPASADEAKTNRKLRLRSAVLLPALFVTYGATMIGETASERLFITNENMATDARIVHQMASVQQSVYRIAPDAVQLAPDVITGITTHAAPAVTAAGAVGAAASVPSAAPSGEPSLSDREKAETFLEQRKQELQDKFRQHQNASAVAAERQQWFAYAKSIVMLSIGMAFWSVLFRSLRMLHASTAAGLISLLLTANGYWLFLRF